MRKLIKYSGPPALSEEAMLSDDLGDLVNATKRILEGMPSGNYFAVTEVQKDKGTRPLHGVIEHLRKSGIDVGRDNKNEYGFEIAQVPSIMEGVDYNWELRLFRRKEVPHIQVDVSVNVHRTALQGFANL